MVFSSPNPRDPRDMPRQWKRRRVLPGPRKKARCPTGHPGPRRRIPPCGNRPGRLGRAWNRPGTSTWELTRKVVSDFDANADIMGESWRMPSEAHRNTAPFWFAPEKWPSSDDVEDPAEPGQESYQTLSPAAGSSLLPTWSRKPMVQWWRILQ